MKLFFLLTFASVFCYKTNGEDYLNYLTIVTVEDPDAQCKDSWSRSACSDRAWYIRSNKRITKKLLTTFPIIDVNECIHKCTTNSECFAVTINSDTCHLIRDGYSVEFGEQPGWTSIEIICCRMIHPKEISSNSNHNLPIVYDPSKDCETGSVREQCSPNEKVWILHENIRFFDNFGKQNSVNRLDCLNKCIDTSNCHYAEDGYDYDNTCFQNDKNRKRVSQDGHNSFYLQCCNVKQENLWKNRKINLPILYDPKKMCISYEPFARQRCTKVKVWHAIESGFMDPPYHHTRNIKDKKIMSCLNTCLANKKCVAVTIKPLSCFYYKNDANMKYGYQMSTTYRLTCCEMK